MVGRPFEDQAEAYLDRRFATTSEVTTERHELFASPAEAYLDRRFGGQPDLDYPEPEICYDDAEAIVRLTPEVIDYVRAEVPPQVSAWLPDVMADLLDTVEAAVRALLADDGVDAKTAKAHHDRLAEWLADECGLNEPTPSMLAVAKLGTDLVRIPERREDFADPGARSGFDLTNEGPEIRLPRVV